MHQLDYSFTCIWNTQYTYSPYSDYVSKIPGGHLTITFPASVLDNLLTLQD